MNTLWSRVVKTESCWLWTGCKSDGYGRIRINGINHLVHRLSYELLVGKIPKGLVIDHLCKVKHCVNPEHLEAVTQKENMDRGDISKTFGGWQRKVTHCPQGHEYTVDNIYYNPKNNGRACRKCRKSYDSKHYSRLKEQALYCIIFTIILKLKESNV